MSGLPGHFPKGRSALARVTGTRLGRPAELEAELAQPRAAMDQLRGELCRQVTEQTALVQARDVQLVDRAHLGRGVHARVAGAARSRS